MKQQHYFMACVGVSPRDMPDFEDMLDRAREVTADTFFKHVCIHELSKAFGYDAPHSRKATLKAREDHHTSYYTSRYKGDRVAIYNHSGIEYLYLLED